MGLSILELSETVMYEFWYNYVKPNYGKKSKTVLYGYSITVYTKTDYIYIGQAVETRIDTLNYELNRPIPKRKNNCN